jgi:hypothetical protein
MQLKKYLIGEGGGLRVKGSCLYGCLETNDCE